MKLGVTTIALRSKAPIIPAVYIGPERFSWRFLISRPKVTIIFGEAIDSSTASSDDNQDERDVRLRLLQDIDDTFQDLLNKVRN